jgi:protein phosphatase
MALDDRLVAGLLVGMAVLVVGLLFIVLAMARSLRAAKDGKREPRRADADRDAKAGAKKPSGTSRPQAAKVSAAPPANEGAAKEPMARGLNANVELDEADITRMTPFSTATHLPRLSVETDDPQDPEDTSESDSKAILLYESEAWVGIDEPTGAHDLILTSAVGQTDRGVTRRRNEDAYLIDTDLQLFAVADGMGGYAGGDVASRLAVQEIRAAVQAPGEIKGHEDRPRRARELIAAVERANAVIHKEAQSTRDLHGMGTTIVLARFSPQKQRVYVAHVGDSRCYRLRKGELQLLTKDHTLASRGVIGPLASNICRALGVSKDVKVDLIIDRPLPDDIYLMCSDGLPKMVTDERIRAILSEQSSLDRAAGSLVLAANANGGRDNITVVLVGIMEVTKTARKVDAIKGPKRVEFGPS